MLWMAIVRETIIVIRDKGASYSTIATKLRFRRETV